EQAGGEAVDQRADLFALGSTLYAMCTGQAPFQGGSGLAVIRQVCDVEPTPIRAINPDVPVWLEGIVRKLHAKDPGKRFQSAAEASSQYEGPTNFDDVHERSSELRARLDSLRQSLAAASPREGIDLETALDSVRQRTEMLRRSLRAAAEPSPDPVATELDSI